MFRPMTLIATLCVAFLIYMVIVGVIFHRLNRMMFVTCGIGSAPAPAPTIRVENGRVTFLGHSAPLVAVVGTTAIPPVWWFASTIYAANVRRTRERLGQCFECGQPLSAKRGRCPRCGGRFERFMHPARPTPVEFQRTMSRYVVRSRS